MFSMMLVVTLSIGGLTADAASPFEGIAWSHLLQHDPRLHADTSYTSNLGDPYASDDGLAGVFDRNANRHVVTGRAGGRWIAALPLDSGGSMGMAGWLLYFPKVAKHFASIAGSETLRFEHDRIVTLSEAGGRETGRGIERTYVVHGSAAVLAGKRFVRLEK